MDGLLSFGKQAYKAYSDSQDKEGQSTQAPSQSPYPAASSSFNIQGSSALNSPDNKRPSDAININSSDAVQAASEDAGGDSGLFSQAMAFINKHKDDDDDVDEEEVQAAHNQAYGAGGNKGKMSASAMGAAAAMQALKSFTSGGEGGTAASSGGGSFQSKLIGRAMSEAAKLYDQNGGTASGDKQDVVSAAGQMVMKLLVKNQVSGMVGGGSSGGLGSLMGMAQQFMK